MSSSSKNPNSPARRRFFEKRETSTEGILGFMVFMSALCLIISLVVSAIFGAGTGAYIIAGVFVICLGYGIFEAASSIFEKAAKHQR